jgi:hypothetical protein
MRQQLRSKLTYANVMATLAVFMVLGGGTFAVAALSGHDKKVVKRLANKQITKRAPGLAVKHAGSADRATPAGVAGGDLNGTYPNPALGAGKVQTANLADGAVTTDKVGQGFLTQAASNRALQFYAHEWNTGGSTNIAFGRVTLQPVATNQFKVCFNFIGSWGYGISIDGGALTLNTPAGSCGPTHTVTTGGSFQINDGQDMIFGSGDASTSGYYFVYGLYSP